MTSEGMKLKVLNRRKHDTPVTAATRRVHLVGSLPDSSLLLLVVIITSTLLFECFFQLSVSDSHCWKPVGLRTGLLPGTGFYLFVVLVW